MTFLYPLHTVFFIIKDPKDFPLSKATFRLVLFTKMSQVLPLATTRAIINFHDGVMVCSHCPTSRPIQRPTRDGKWYTFRSPRGNASSLLCKSEVVPHFQGGGGGGVWVKQHFEIWSPTWLETSKSANFSLSAGGGKGGGQSSTYASLG